MSFDIGQVLETQEPFALDIASVITGRTFLASITRWGKSWTARKIVEESFGHAGIIIIDPEGEYISLREKYPLLIIGKDIPLQVETAEFMAEKVLESKISIIIDLSMTEVELGKEYVDKFLRRFFFLETTLRQPYLIVLEEAEEFGPEKGIATSTSLEILRNITKKGGKRGIGILIIAHRPAWVSKGIISQCANKALGRIDWPADLKVLEDFARVPHETIEKLPTLAKGEFCFAGDWVKTTTFVKVGKVKTTHLGFTPEVIPPSPKELKTVIESLQKALPEVIEKIKPTVIPIAEMEAKIKSELEKKYRERIEAIQRTAEEKAERKFKGKIDQLQTHIENLSRSQALQPTAPITDALDHPIVKTRMLELPDKARDLLIKIEREPGLTREQLAAFLTTSKDTVAGLVDKINRVFRATVIIGDGKPIRYKSMLKRLFITDVAKREIEELERLQADNKMKGERIQSLEHDVETLRSAAQQSVTLRGEVERLKTGNAQLSGRLEKQELEIKDLKHHNATLTKENQAFQKIKEGFAGLGVASTVSPIDEEKVRTVAEAKVKELLEEDKTTSLLSPEQVEELVKKHVKDFMNQLPSGAVGLQNVTTIVSVPSAEKLVTINTESMRGKILAVSKKGKLDSWQRLDAIVKAVEEEHWSATPQEVNNALNDLEKQGLIAKKHTDRNYYCLAQGVVFEKKEVTTT